MSVATFSRVLFVVSLCGISQAYFPYRPPSCNSGPRYDSCRDSIEDLKALVEVTQVLKDNNNCCPICANTFSEELILKLVNALIYTATHNCGYYEGGHNPGGYPWGPGNGGNPGVKHPSGEKPGKNEGALINLGVLDGKDTVGLSVGNTKVLGVDVGPQSGSGGSGYNGSGGSGYNGNSTGGKNSEEALLNVGVLNKGNSLVNVGLAGTDLLNVDVGKNKGHGESTGYPSPGNSGKPPLVKVGVLDKKNSLLNVGLAGTDLLNVDVGKGKSYGESTGYPTPVNSNGYGATTSPPAKGSGINPSNSNNQGGITNPENNGDVNQVNQSVTKVTNNISKPIVSD